MSRRIKQQLDIWKEGSFVDLWTVIHFLAGVLLGFAPFIFPYDFWNIFWVVLGLLILWEVYEHVNGIHETIWNRLIDILIAVLGFGLTVFAVPFFAATTVTIGAAILLVVYIVLNLAGWRAYRNRQKK